MVYQDLKAYRKIGGNRTFVGSVRHFESNTLCSLIANNKGLYIEGYIISLSDSISL